MQGAWQGDVEVISFQKGLLTQVHCWGHMATQEVDNLNNLVTIKETKISIN